MVWLEQPSRDQPVLISNQLRTPPACSGWRGSCVSCFPTVLLCVNFSLNAPRHLKTQQLLQWVCSYLCVTWLKQRYIAITSAKSPHFLLSKAQESRVPISSWGLPWVPTNFAKWSWSKGQLGTLSIAQEGQKHLLTPETLTCKKKYLGREAKAGWV